MSRNHFTLFLLSFLCIETATAKSIIDCRVVIGGITECNPYGTKFLKAKEIVYEVDRQKLIREKILPVPEKKSFVKVVSVEDMIERYVKVQECVRFKGSAKTPIKVTKTKEPVAIMDEKTEACEVSPGMKRELLEQTAPEKRADDWCLDWAAILPRVSQTAAPDAHRLRGQCVLPGSVLQ